MTDPSPLRILLVEDNPGDARLIEEMLDELEAVPDRVVDRPGDEEPNVHQARSGVDRLRFGRPELTHVTRLSAGLDHLDGASEPPDVVLLDLNLPDSRGLETLRRVRERAEAVPIVVLTGLQDRQFGVRALTQGAHEYLVKDEIHSDLLVRSAYHAIERASYEARIEAQRDRLETLNELNGLVQDVTQAMIGRSTRAEIERTVCEQLASSGLYAAAWIGDLAPDGETVRMRAAAGVGDAAGDGPNDAPDGPQPSRAIRRQEAVVARHIADGEDRDDDEDEEAGRWLDAARALGCRAAVAVPIAYEQSLYGVLTLYAERPDAFEERERVVAERLGEAVGHTINAVETKRRLLADTVVELQFESTSGDLFFVAASERLDCSFRLDRVVPAAGDDLLYYVTVEGATTDAVLEMAAEMPSIDRARLIRDGFGDESVYEFTLAGASVVVTLTRRNAKVTAAVAESGTVRFTAEVPPKADVRAVVDAVTETHPSVGFVARREVDRRRRTRRESLDVLDETLTGRQRSALHAAYHSGFFEWPRESTGEEVAESLGISAPTYHEHLRNAQQKVLTELFEGDVDADEEWD